MVSFFLKKNFCDIWDNLFHLLIVNLTQLVLLACAVLGFIGISKLPVIEGIKNLISLFFFALVVILFCISIFSESKNAAKIVNYEGAKIRTYFSGLLSSLKMGVLYGLFISLLFAIAFISIPYYFSVWVPQDGSQSNFLGLIGLAIVFWFELISLLALQWFIPVHTLLKNGFLKCLKKSYIIFFDNIRFSLLLALVNLVNIIVTVFTLGMIPGINGTVLSSTNALRLRLYKYDWYEVNPGMTKEQRKEVPWEDLLYNDKKALGKRSWKSFIFPWRDE